MGAEATLYLFEHGVRVTGTDAWSWDAPFAHTAKNMRRPLTPRSSGKATRPDATSATAISRNWTISSAAPVGFEVSCFPVKIERASAGWTRAVAIIED